MEVKEARSKEDGQEIEAVLNDTIGDNELLALPGLIWFVLDDGEGTVGVAYAHAISHVRVYVNMIFLPETEDKPIRKELGKAFLEMFNSQNGAKLECTIPVSEPEKLKLYQQVGFKREGMCRSSILKDGVLEDQYYVGLSLAE